MKTHTHQQRNERMSVAGTKWVMVSLCEPQMDEENYKL